MTPVAVYRWYRSTYDNDYQRNRVAQCNTRLVGGAPGISPVLVAVAGRTNAALPRS